jgi:hypothetical protein
MVRIPAMTVDDEDAGTVAAGATEADEREDREAGTEERYMGVQEKGKSRRRELFTPQRTLA